MTDPAPPRTLVRLSQGADEAGVPRATVRAWASQPNQQLYPVGIDDEGIKVYDLARIRELANTTQRRRRRRTTRSADTP